MFGASLALLLRKSSRSPPRWTSGILDLSRLGAIASGSSLRGPASVGHYLQPIVEGLLQYHVRTNIQLVGNLKPPILLDFRTLHLRANETEWRHHFSRKCSARLLVPCHSRCEEATFLGTFGRPGRENCASRCKSSLCKMALEQCDFNIKRTAFDNADHFNPLCQLI